MDYNNYDSNGNKKKININLNDRKQKSRLILAIYGVIFIVLIIFIRTSGVSSNISNTSDKNNTNTNTNSNHSTNIIDNNTNIVNSINDEEFAFVNDHNYEFTIKLEYDNVLYISDGKRYNDKFDFNYSFNGELYRFIGTLDKIKTYNNETSSYEIAHLPYFYINYYDNSKLYEIIKSSNLIDDVYEIDNLKLSSISGISLLNNSNNGVNRFKLIKKNNKIVGIDIDISSVVSNSTNKDSLAKINIEYRNFGLVEDFDIDFE